VITPELPLTGSVPTPSIAVPAVKNNTRGPVPPIISCLNANAPAVSSATFTGLLMLSSLPGPTITKPLLPAINPICLNISKVSTHPLLAGSGLSTDSPPVTSWAVPAANNPCVPLPVNSIGCLAVDTTGVSTATFSELPVLSSLLEPSITKPLLPANKSICLKISTVITCTFPLSGS